MATMKVSAISANDALRSSEFVVGILMGLYGVKVLLPAAVGLLLGMVNGFKNARLLFPGEAGE
jgi:hypothetical protein